MPWLIISSAINEDFGSRGGWLFLCPSRVGPRKLEALCIAFTAPPRVCRNKGVILVFRCCKSTVASAFAKAALTAGPRPERGIIKISPDDTPTPMTLKLGLLPGHLVHCMACSQGPALGSEVRYNDTLRRGTHCASPFLRIQAQPGLTTKVLAGTLEAPWM